MAFRASRGLCRRKSYRTLSSAVPIVAPIIHSGTLRRQLAECFRHGRDSALHVLFRVPRHCHAAQARGPALADGGVAERGPAILVACVHAPVAARGKLPCGPPPQLAGNLPARTLAKVVTSGVTP